MRLRGNAKHEIRQCKASEFEQAKEELRGLGIRILDWWRSGTNIVMKCMRPKEQKP